ncbi:hypothetical protein [Daejeonella sp.]|uniref:hypothetical protein n=1 Tax=Daejeonella sp. TaxID=2805397 RepID=UPI0030C447A5
MKHLIILVSALVFMSASVHADDFKKTRKNKNQAVAAAPFVWGDPAEDVPLELAAPDVAKMQVPVAPFVWGSPEDVFQIVESIKLKNAAVPVAPFVFGSPDEEISLDL